MSALERLTNLYSNIPNRPNRGRQVTRYSRFGITIGGYSSNIFSAIILPISLTSS